MHGLAPVAVTVLIVLGGFLAGRAIFRGRLRAVRASLDAGEARRACARVRLASRRSRYLDRSLLVLQDGWTRFWTGDFDRALTLVKPLAGERDGARLRPQVVALEILCLVFTDRIDDARRRLDAHVGVLADADDIGAAIVDVDTLAAIVGFHEGRRAASRDPFEAALTRGDALSFVAHYYLAAIAHDEGNLEDARRHLAASIAGGDLFVAELAREEWATLFSEPVPAEPARARALASMPSLLVEGLRLVALRRSAFAGVRFTVDQLFALSLVNLLIALGLRLAEYQRGAFFASHAAFLIATPVLSVTLVAHLATRPLPKTEARVRRHPTTHTAGALQAALPMVLVLEFAASRLAYPRVQTILFYALGAWFSVMVARVLRQVSGPGASLRVATGCAIFAVAWLFPLHEASSFMRLWYVETTESPSRVDEATFYLDQADRLHGEETRVLAGRPGIEDLYFLGVAAYGTQDVFSSEVHSARELLDRRFDTVGRSLGTAPIESAVARRLARLEKVVEGDCRRSIRRADMTSAVRAADIVQSTASPRAVTATRR